MADDRLACCRSASIAPTNSCKVMLRSPAISFRLFQNSSSRLTLVLWPAMTIERFEIGDFTASPPANGFVRSRQRFVPLSQTHSHSGGQSSDHSTDGGY